MAKFLETEKKRLSKAYTQSIFNLYSQDLITDEEMDIVAEDIDELKTVFKSQPWHDLNFFSSRFSFSNAEIEKIVDNSINCRVASPYTKMWIKSHIDRGHYGLLDRTIKEFAKNILHFYVEIPDFINFNEEKGKRIAKIVRKFYFQKILDEKKDRFVKVVFQIKEFKAKGPEFEIDETFKNIANTLFDYELELLEKKLFKS